ncbi:hypothetical protein LguiB_031870 [Lonicera macranthoides]
MPLTIYHDGWGLKTGFKTLAHLKRLFSQLETPRETLDPWKLNPKRSGTIRNICKSPPNLEGNMRKKFSPNLASTSPFCEYIHSMGKYFCHIVKVIQHLPRVLASIAVGNGVGSLSDDETEASAIMTFEELMTSQKPVILSHDKFCKIVMGCAAMYTPCPRPVQPALPLDDPNAETIVLVYRINDLSHQELSHEIYCRTIGYLLAGYMVGLDDGFTVVVVSGKQKSIDKHKRLMLKRINWVAVKKSQNTEDEEENKKNEVNKCVLLWEGSAAKRIEASLTLQHMSARLKLRLDRCVSK